MPTDDALPDLIGDTQGLLELDDFRIELLHAEPTSTTVT
jgi:hypothetical protein